MRPHQFVLALVLFMGVLSIIGGLVMSGSNNYDEVKPSNEFSEKLTGNNNSEYRDKVENLEKTAQETGGEDGFLAQYKLGIASLNLVSSSVSQASSVITGIAEYMQLPPQLIALFIVIVVILAIFGGIYLIMNR